tara:strand:- start:77 stop:937 length:861 start_codon:yes stop_codon:yes gene_type:complete
MLYKNNYKTLIDNNKTKKSLEFIINNKLYNLIIYGAPGSNKYVTALKYIQQFSESKLEYDKKLILTTSKTEHIIKISDIHYEIDFQQIKYNSKILFNDIYNNIVNNIILYSKNNVGIVLCRNFHEIDNELLEIFYSYMQKIINQNYKVYFILLTESISFIPNNIKKICNKIYLNFIEKNKINDKLIYNHYYRLCDSIVLDISCKSNHKKIKNIRNNLYDTLIYNYNVSNIFYDVICILIEKNLLKTIDFKFIEETFKYYYYYNNNYRPIFHLENYILYLIKLVHGY